MLYQTLLLLIGAVVGVTTATVIFWSFKYRNIRDEEGEKIGFLKRGVIGHRQTQKHRNLEKLKSHIQNKDTITNDEVEKLLGVSHATAWRYLKDLEKDGILEQMGETGQSVEYRIIKK